MLQLLSGMVFSHTPSLNTNVIKLNVIEKVLYLCFVLFCFPSKGVVVKNFCGKIKHD